MPLECKNCYKIFCQNCQIQLSKAGGQGPQRAGAYDDEDIIERLIEEDGMKLDRSPTARRNQRAEWMNRKSSTSGKTNKERFNYYRQSNQNETVQCPHCKCKGEIF
jgi:hypothetical protein